MDQLKNQSEDIKRIETAIFSSGQRLGAVLKENHRLEIKMYSTFVYFFPWRFPVEYLGHKWLESMVLPNCISLSHFVSFLFHVGSRFKQVRLLIMFLNSLPKCHDHFYSSYRQLVADMLRVFTQSMLKILYAAKLTGATDTLRFQQMLSLLSGYRTRQFRLVCNERGP